MHRLRPTLKKTFKHLTDQEKKEIERKKAKLNKQIEKSIKEEILYSL